MAKKKSAKKTAKKKTAPKISGKQKTAEEEVAKKKVAKKKGAEQSADQSVKTPAAKPLPALPEMSLYMPVMQIEDGKVADKSGHGRDGVVEAVEGHEAQLFDGKSWINLASSADELGLNNSSFTVSALLRTSNEKSKIEAGVFATTGDKGTENAYLHLMFKNRKPYLGFWANDSQGIQALVAGRWYHVTWRYDKTKQEQAIFIDGVLDKAEPNHAPLTSTAGLTIGRALGQSYTWEGSILQLRVFPAALDDEQVKQLAQRDQCSRLIDLDLQNMAAGKATQAQVNQATNIGVDGELRGSVTIEEDTQLGKYLRLRQPSHVEFPGLAAYFAGASGLKSFSILMWIRLAPVETEAETDILSCGDPDKQRWRLWRAGSQIGFEFPTGAQTYKTLRGNLRTDLWTHVAVIGPSPTYLFLNGQFVTSSMWESDDESYWNPLNNGPIVLGGRNLSADIAHLTIGSPSDDYPQIQGRLPEYSGFFAQPVADLPLGELVDGEAPGMVRDHSGKGNDGVVHGDGNLFAGQAWIELGSADDLKLNNSSFTVTAFIKPDLEVGGFILGVDTPGPSNGVLMLTVSREQNDPSPSHLPQENKPLTARMSFHPGEQIAEAAGQTPMIPGNWYAVAWRYDLDRQEQKVFVLAPSVLANGMTGKAVLERPPLNAPGDQRIRVGRLIDAFPFRGSIRHLRVFSSALSEDQILQLFKDDALATGIPYAPRAVRDLPEMTLHLPLLKTASAVDKSPRAISNGFVHGGAEPQKDDVFGLALVFDRAGQSVTLRGTWDALELPQGFLIEVWIRPESNDLCTVFSIENGSFSTEQRGRDATRTLLYGPEMTGPIWPGADPASVPFTEVGGIAVSTWTHLALGSDGHELSLYVDGQLKKSQPFAPVPKLPIGFNLCELRVGGTSSASHLRILPGPVLTGNEGPIQAVWDAGGRRLATVGRDHTVRIWTAAGAALHTLGVADGTDSAAGHIDQVTCAAFSPDGSRLATGSKDTTVRLWDVKSGELLHTLGKPNNSDHNVGHTAPVATLSFSTDTDLLVTADNGGDARLWHASNGESYAHKDGSAARLQHEGAITFAAFSRDGTSILTCSEDATAKVWDLSPISGSQIENELKARLTLASHEGPIRHASYSSDGKKIVTCSDDKTARVWDAASGVLQHVLKGHTGGVTQALFIQSDASILTTSQDTTANRYDLSGNFSVRDSIRTHQPLGQFTSHTSAILSAQLIDGGQQILTASADKAVVWEPQTLAEVSQLESSGTISGASADLAARKIAVACDDGTIQLWYQPAAFKGRMANLRVFDTAQSPEAIRQRIERDILKTATGTIFPLEFSLHNSQHQNVIYIGDLPKTLTLEVTNTGRKNISLAEAGTNGHFELHFRPGTLKDPEQVTLQPQAGDDADDTGNWHLQYDADRAQQDGTQVFQLTRQANNGAPASHTLVAGKALRLHLGKILADERGGARSTRVQLRYSLQYDDQSPVEGSRLHYLSVLQMSESEMQENVDLLKDDAKKKETRVSELEKSQKDLSTKANDAADKLHGFTGTVKELADKVAALQKLDEQQIAKLQKMLDAEEGQITDALAAVKTLQQEIALLSPNLVAHTVGPDVVITGGGSTNTIKIWVVNRSDQSLAMKDKHSGTPSKLTFDLHPDKPWGLCTKNNLGVLRTVSDNAWVESYDKVNGRIELTYNGTKTNCRANESLAEITLSNLTSSQPPGEAHVTISYENVGNSHGSLYVSLQRSAVASQAQSNGRNLTVVDGEVDFVNSPTLGFRQPHWPSDGPAPPASISLEGADNLKIHANGKVTLQPNGKVEVNNLLLTGNAGAHGSNISLTGLKELTAQQVSTRDGVSYSGSPGYLVPKGAIMMWHGSPTALPHGWVLCNGQHGTPDLRDRFIVGAGRSYAAGHTGGSNTVKLQKSEMPSHDHSMRLDDKGHSHTTDIWLRQSYTDLDDDSFPVYARNYSSRANTHTATSNVELHHVSEGSSQPHENRPPYYALCFIMKT